MPQPSIGRKVWYRPVGSTIEQQPHDATVVYVYSDTMVNLACHDAMGNPYSMASVYLWPGEDYAPRPADQFAEWMPFQISQAKANPAA